MAEKRPAYCLYRERKSPAESFRAWQRGGMRCPPHLCGKVGLIPRGNSPKASKKGGSAAEVKWNSGSAPLHTMLCKGAFFRTTYASQYGVGLACMRCLKIPTGLIARPKRTIFVKEIFLCFLKDCVWT